MRGKRAESERTGWHDAARGRERGDLHRGVRPRGHGNVAWLRQNVDVKPEAKTNGLRYDALARLQLKPGRYEDPRRRATSAGGTRRQRLRVRRCARVRQARPVARQASCWRAAQELLATPADAVADVSPVVADLAARVRAHRQPDRRSFGFIEAAMMPPRSVRARIVDATSKTVFDNTVTLQVADLAKERGAEVAARPRKLQIAVPARIRTIEARGRTRLDSRVGRRGRAGRGSAGRSLHVRGRASTPVY